MSVTTDTRLNNIVDKVDENGKNLAEVPPSSGRNSVFTLGGVPSPSGLKETYLNDR